jgi:DNA (cytosine-5)-methyltransferase 1
MNGKDYEIPQNRERCFMVSALGDYYYEFPKKKKCKNFFLDFCDSNVDKKYYLDNKKLNYILSRPKNYECKINPNYSNTFRTNYSGGCSNESLVMDENGTRWLEPKEVFRLMGVKDEDFERVAKNQSDSSLYHLAGDSIITNCLMAIFNEML